MYRTCSAFSSSTTARPPVSSAMPDALAVLLEFAAPLRHHRQELLDLGVDLLDVGRKEAARGVVAGDRLRVDGHRAYVADVARGLQRLPLRVQEILDAGHDERLGLDGSKGPRVVPVHPRRGAHVVGL